MVLLGLHEGLPHGRGRAADGLPGRPRRRHRPYEDIGRRFDDWRALLAFGAACIWLADLDLLSGFYHRARSAQELATGTANLEGSRSAGDWYELAEAALSFKAKLKPFEADVLAAVRERVLHPEGGTE